MHASAALAWLTMAPHFLPDEDAAAAADPPKTLEEAVAVAEATSPPNLPPRVAADAAAAPPELKPLFLACIQLQSQQDI